MYKPLPVGEVYDTDKRRLAVSVDHGVVRIDALGDIIFLEPDVAELLSVMIEGAVSEATADA